MTRYQWLLTWSAILVFGIIVAPIGWWSLVSAFASLVLNVMAFLEIGYIQIGKLKFGRLDILERAERAASPTEGPKS
jgi:hypothetical protein